LPRNALEQGKALMIVIFDIINMQGIYLNARDITGFHKPVGKNLQTHRGALGNLVEAKRENLGLYFARLPE
jgi:hypothetical protein